jgi:hypothetical protein
MPGHDGTVKAFSGAYATFITSFSEWRRRGAVMPDLVDLP